MRQSAGIPTVALGGVFLWMVLLAILPMRLPAQDSLPAPLARLKPGQRIRLLIVDGPRLEARVAGLTNDPAAVRLDATDSLVPLTAIDSLWQRRTRAGTGAWIGAAALGVPSVIFWGWFCNAVSEGTGCDAWNVVAGLSLAGAAVGAGVGALIGSGVVRWELRYARPGGSAHWRLRGDGELRVGVRLGFP
jgi:hypothetical protein